MDSVGKDFWRTMHFMSLLEIENCNSVSNSIIDFTAKINDLIGEESYLNKKSKKALSEIYKIELEKNNLKNSCYAKIQKIAESELFVYQEREIILCSNFENFFEENFIVNPMLRIYSSQWNWVLDRIYKPTSLMENTKYPKAGKFFFAFLATGSVDPFFRSNILEFPLNEYQYFLLQYFIKPRTIVSAIQFFQAQFEPDSEIEREQLKDLTLNIFRELIYKTFIVQSRTTLFGLKPT